jgi:hypothetical protein
MNTQKHIDAQVLELHLLIADEIERRPHEAMDYAHTTLTRWRSVNGDHPYYREWAKLLHEGPSAVVALIRYPGDRATLLRSVSPFAAYLKAERDAIFSRRPA